MKTSVFSIDDKVIGTADITVVYFLHYNGNAKVQLAVSENHFFSIQVHMPPELRTPALVYWNTSHFYMHMMFHY